MAVTLVGGKNVTAILTANITWISIAADGTLQTEKRPEASILLGFPAFLGTLWTSNWWAVMDSQKDHNTLI